MICVRYHSPEELGISPHRSGTTHIPHLHQQLLSWILSSSCVPHSKSRAAPTQPSRPSPPACNRQASPGGLWLRGVDNLSQKEDALVLVEKISTRKGLVIVLGPEGDKATGGCCSLGANLIHHQDGFVETLGRKSQALPLREHELGLRED